MAAGCRHNLRSGVGRRRSYGLRDGRELVMKKLLMLVGMTGMLALVSAGTRANAAAATEGDDGFGISTCNAEECHALCVDEGCTTGECLPNLKGMLTCQCYNAHGKCD